VRFALAVLVAGAVIGALAIALASRLKLRTSFAELLPSDDPAVLALKRTESRVGDLNLLTVGIRSPDRAANLAYAKILTDALRALPSSRVGLVAYHMRDLQTFFHDHRWLYVGVPELEDIRDRLRSEILRRKNPLVVPLDDDDPGGAGGAGKDAELRARLERQPLMDRFPDGYFVNGDVAWVLVLPAGGLFDEHAGEDLVGLRLRLEDHPDLTVLERRGCLGRTPHREHSDPVPGKSVLVEEGLQELRARVDNSSADGRDVLALERGQLLPQCHGLGEPALFPGALTDRKDVRGIDLRHADSLQADVLRG